MNGDVKGFISSSASIKSILEVNIKSKKMKSQFRKNKNLDLWVFNDNGN